MRPLMRSKPNSSSGKLRNGSAIREYCLRPLQFLAVLLTALYLVPTGAHLFELPNKIGLPQQPYFVVQQIYRGWAWFGMVIPAAIAANLAAGLILLRRRRRPWPAFAAGFLLLLSLVVFFAWTYPTNQATHNWTFVPPDWQALRQQWEASHAANAILTFLALCCATWSAMTARDRTQVRRAEEHSEFRQGGQE